MTSEINWQTGDGLLGIGDPAEIDAAFERGERFVGNALIGLVMNCDDLALVAPRVERGLRSSDPKVREYSFVAASSAARVFGELSPGIYEILRAEGRHGEAENAIADALTFVPFRDMPWWLKRVRVTSSVGRFVSTRWANAIVDIQSGFQALGELWAKRGPGKRRDPGSGG